MGFSLGGSLGHMIGGATNLFGEALGGITGFLQGPAPTPNAPFRPMATSGPFGSTSYEDGTYNMQLSPEMQQLQQQLFGSLAGGPQMSQAQQQFANMGQLFGGQVAGLGQQAGAFNRNLGMQAAGIGSGFLNAANMTDPSQIAANQYQLMQDVVAPGREEQRLSTEGRLLRQGLLGSTAGKNRFAGLETGFNRADTQMAMEALRQGMQTQGQLFGQGLRGIGAGSDLFRSGTAQEMGGLQTGLGLFGTGVAQEQAANQDWMRNLGAMQGLQQGLFNQAQIGMGGGAQQAAINQANTAQMNAYNQSGTDIQNALLFGGAQMMMGMPPTGFGGVSQAGAQPQFFQQSPYPSVQGLPSFSF